MKKNYKIEKYPKRSDWLKARCIGGTDLAKLINKVARWGNFIELYDELTDPQIEEDKTSISMTKGREAEEHIKDLFLIAHPELRRISPSRSIWLIRRKDFKEITLSPDTLVKQGNQLGYLEIKYKEIYSEKDIPLYLMDLKKEEPQYYWQNIHYYVTMNDLSFGYMVVAFAVYKKEESTGNWLFDKYIIDSLKTDRETLADDIKQGEEALEDFITNNLRARVRPKSVLKDTKEVKIEWNKLSNIQTLK